jgi:hypothetical protein
MQLSWKPKQVKEVFITYLDGSLSREESNIIYRAIHKKNNSLLLKLNNRLRTWFKIRKVFNKRLSDTFIEIYPINLSYPPKTLAKRLNLISQTLFSTGVTVMSTRKALYKHLLFEASDYKVIDILSLAQELIKHDLLKLTCIVDSQSICLLFENVKTKKVKTLKFPKTHFANDTIWLIYKGEHDNDS